MADILLRGEHCRCGLEFIKEGSYEIEERRGARNMLAMEQLQGKSLGPAVNQGREALPAPVYVDEPAKAVGHLVAIGELGWGEGFLEGGLMY